LSFQEEENKMADTTTRDRERLDRIVKKIGVDLDTYLRGIMDGTRQYNRTGKHMDPFERLPEEDFLFLKEHYFSEGKMQEFCAGTMDSQPLDGNGKKKMAHIIRKLGVLPQKYNQTVEATSPHECDNIEDPYARLDIDELTFLQQHNFGLDVTEEDLETWEVG
jgi:hypothetical protein